MRYWYKEQQDDVITKLNYWLICFNHIDSNIKKINYSLSTEKINFSLL